MKAGNLFFILGCGAGWVLGCAGGAQGSKSATPCNAEILDDAPPFQTDHVGSVAVSCDVTDTKAVCLEQLKAEACKLGGDIAWGVTGPTQVNGRTRYTAKVAKKKP